MSKKIIGIFLIVIGFVGIIPNLFSILFGTPGIIDLLKVITNEFFKGFQTNNEFGEKTNESLDILNIASWIIPLILIIVGTLLLFV